MKDHRLYVIVRNDLPSMNPGKAMAQVNHAGTQAYNELKFNIEFNEWLKQANGFGTCIVLESTHEKMLSVIETANYYNFNCGIITDPTYPFTIQKEIIPYLDKELIEQDNFIISDVNAPYTNIFATRTEQTCAWVFVNEEKLQYWKESTDNLNLQLHK